MRTYVKTQRRLIAAGYDRDRALLLVAATWALSPDDIVRLAAAVQ